MKFKKNTLLFLSSLIISIIVAEIAVRIISPVNFKRDERNLLYRYDEFLGWFPKENSKDKYSKKWAPRKVLVEHNSLGFRDDEFVDSEKKNIIFLGDSFVWGYDVEKEERFTEILRKTNNQYDIYNLGISGYGTDQELLLLQKYYEKFKPKIIFLIFSPSNDYLDNSSNTRYGGYFKPYFEIKNNDLVLKGSPVPKSNNYSLVNFYKNNQIIYRSHIVKNIAMIIGDYKNNRSKTIKVKDPTMLILKKMDNFIKQKNAKFIIASVDYDKKIDDFTKNNNITYIDLDNNFRYPKRGRHWTPKGHKYVANLINKSLDSIEQTNIKTK